MNPERLQQSNKPPSSDLEIKSPTSKRKVSPEQAGAIKFCAEAGRQIQKTCPEIAIDYINGSSLLELVDKYDIQEKFKAVNRKTAKIAVLNALRGYSGNSSDTYLGLIKDPEILRDIASKHRKGSSKKTGERMRDEGRGMFGMTEEERRQVGGRSGMNLYQTGRGIHAQTPEERIKLGKEAVLARGFVPFSEEEEAFMKNVNLNEYQTRGTKINAKKITQELNEKFHNGSNVRKADTVGQFLGRIKKRNTPRIG